MAFETQKNGEPPVAAVDWRDVSTFTVGIVERAEGRGRKQAVLGPNAVRVPRREGRERVYAPCAFFRSGAEGIRPGEWVLYEDREVRRVLCRMTQLPDEGGERRYEVRDGAGRELGRIARIPASGKLARHSWRVEQPDRPEILSRNRWAAFARGEVSIRSTGRLIGEAVGSAVALALDDTPEVDRSLIWRSGKETVMESSGRDFTITAKWLDVRLAFAVAVLGDD
ncbi:hypothetical protein [Streptomyces palmae]|uniref:Uncharacterized protein n=1 Tax=Streptomyces palmae TaxID=1701085 RepID=A0A4Z0G1G0_9ACTN|nr:hypothetical protein [Streptomyces palmae]TGA88322.1 hypothetical protein E4099_29665 [Streptomyces palmae]